LFESLSTGDVAELAEASMSVGRAGENKRRAKGEQESKRRARGVYRNERSKREHEESRESVRERQESRG
jgi:hypothetical protein